MYEEITKMVTRAICTLVSIRLGGKIVTMEEVQDIYDSGKYPSLNAEIDYIIDGRKENA